MGDDRQQVLATDAGYGFVASMGELFSKNRAGKSMVTVPKGAESCRRDHQRQRMPKWLRSAIPAACCCFRLPTCRYWRQGSRSWAFRPPRCRAGVPGGAGGAGAQGSLQIVSGKRTLTLKPSDLEHYRGERGRRGNKLPRGFQKVDSAGVAP